MRAARGCRCLVRAAIGAAALTTISAARSSIAAQDGLSVGTMQTQAKQQAVRIVADYLKLIPTDFFAASPPPTKAGEPGWWVMVYPEGKLLTGDKDSFQGIIAKFTGTFARFQTKQLGTGWVVDMDRTMWTFPLSAGTESDGAFRRVNAVAEAGFVPIIPGEYGSKRYWIGAFVQGGRKFNGTDSSTATSASPSGENGATDQSKETVNGGIARLKVDSRINLPLQVATELKLRLIGKGTVWYDLLNSATYHRIEGTLRIPLSAKESFDFSYERGSGAPNFNKGDQLSANLRVSF